MPGAQDEGGVRLVSSDHNVAVVVHVDVEAAGEGVAEGADVGERKLRSRHDLVRLGVGSQACGK